MEDVITANSPPSRFLLEDLNNFTTPAPPLPIPFISFSPPYPNKPLTPSLLIIAMSSPSLHFFHHVPSKTLLGTLILPEIPFSGNSLEPFPSDKTCNVYALNSENDSVLVICVQFHVPPERAHSVAKSLIGGQIAPKSVLVLESVQSRNFRGHLSLDEPYAYKLETSEKRNNKSGDSSVLKGVDYFPSGSVVEGLSAALLSQCEIKKLEGTLYVSWPEFGGPVSKFVKSLLLKDVLPNVDYKVDDEDEVAYCRFGQAKDHFLDSDLYT